MIIIVFQGGGDGRGYRDMCKTVGGSIFDLSYYISPLFQDRTPGIDQADPGNGNRPDPGNRPDMAGLGLFYQKRTPAVAWRG